MKKILLVILCAAYLTACKKDKGDTQEPMINVTSPTANQQFTAGQTVNVVATMTDDDELNEVHLFVTNKSTGVDVVHFANHVDVETYTITQSFTAGAGITYNVKFEATDHSGNHAEVQFEIKGN
jgi:hypothetical protein